jgi:hypothetical protein
MMMPGWRYANVHTAPVRPAVVNAEEAGAVEAITVFLCRATVLLCVGVLGAIV